VRCATLHSKVVRRTNGCALKDFKEGAVQGVGATDHRGTRIDVDGISHVVNYDFPMHVEDYIHRIGRTGRANQIGDAIQLCDQRRPGELRALEAVHRRGIIAQKAEGFN
jgi:ATP-dependent RNA helicase RhlE